MNVDDVGKELERVIKDVREGMEVKAARVIVQACDSRWKSMKAKVEYFVARGEKPPKVAFFDQRED